MTPATSVTFFKPEFGDFLYASIGGGAEKVPTTVMSALARLGLDPWQEAAELTELSSAAATVRLSSLLARLPLTQCSLVSSKAFIGGLIELLPRHLPATIATPTFLRPAFPVPVPARMLIFAVLSVGIIVATIANQSAPTHDAQAHPPSASSTAPTSAH
jgi:hypothetical protein